MPSSFLFIHYLCSMKFFRELLLIPALSLAACKSSVKQTELPDLDPRIISSFNLTNIATLNTPPAHSFSAWNTDALKKAGVTKIHLLVNGGKSPEDTLDLIELKFTDDYENLYYRQIRNGDFNHPLAIGTISYTPGKGGNINYSRYFSVDDPFDCRITEVPGAIRFARKPSGDNRDSTKIFGAVNHPKLIVSSQNNTVYSLEAFVDERTSTSEIVSLLKKNGYPPEKLIHARATVTFMRNSRPQQTFLLSPEFSQVAVLKSWNYNSKGSLIKYAEYEADIRVRNFIFHYSDNQVFPTSAELDSKHYSISYY